MHILLIRSLALVFAVFFLNGCGSGSSGMSGKLGVLTFVGNTNKTSYASGENVHLTFTVTNTGTTPLSVSGGGLNYPGNSKVPLWIRIERNGQLVTQMVNNNGVNGYSTLEPGEASTNVVDWDQKDNNSVQVPAGTYTVKFILSVDRLGGHTLTTVTDDLTAPPVYVTVH